MTLATHLPIGVKNPIMVRAREAQLLETLRGSPEGLRVPALAVSTGSSIAAVSDRLTRLLRRGEVERVGWLWRIPRDDGDDGPAELALPEPEPEDPGRWVKPIGSFVRRDTSDFSCRRFG
jgi:hypothetical protein